MFIPINYEDGAVVSLPVVAATYTKGQALSVTGGNYTTAAADQNGEVFAVSLEGKVVATTGLPLLCVITRGVRFLADCEAAPAQTDVGTFCDLAAATTLDTDSSTDDTFFIEKIDTSYENGGLGPVGTSTRVFGYFNHANPNA